MKHVAMPCPFASCVTATQDFGKPVMFTTFICTRELVEHLEIYHPEHMGHELNCHSDILLPRWKPHPPARPLQKPPPLPEPAVFRAAILLGKIVTVESSPCLTQSSIDTNFTPSIMPIRRKMLQPHRDEDLSSSTKPRTLYDFADLPIVSCDIRSGIFSHPSMLAPPSLVVRRISDGVSEYKDLARPLPLHEVPVQEYPPPPTSIFFDALSRQVYAQYAAGEGAVTDEDP
jgi:hypothetical protein